jgi:hypothetical protein
MNKNNKSKNVVERVDTDRKKNRFQDELDKHVERAVIKAIERYPNTFKRVK